MLDLVIEGTRKDLAAAWKSAAFCRLRADGWLGHSFFWITWGLPTFALVKASTSDRTPISACPRSPIYSMVRSITATVLASAKRSALARLTG